MRYASVCDGIGAAHVAWQPLGWQCQWTSEIEPFPAAVVEHHYGFRNLGDMTAITEEMLDEPVDVLVGGTPCQSFSVAGLRGGLADPRGNLALRFVQLAAVMQPRWIVWENVPGVLSSGGGRDFGTFLGALAELGYGFAYRVLDAQWFGVAQRRRRVFVVGYLGDWRRAAAVLFERESVFGNPPTRGATGKTAPTIPSRSTAGGGLGTDFDCDGGLIQQRYGFADGSGDDLAKPLGSHALSKGRGTDLDNTTYVAFAQNQQQEVRELVAAGALPAIRRGDAKNETLIAFHPTQDPISSTDGSTHAMGCGSKQGCCTQAVAFKPSHYTRGKDGAPSEVTAPLSADADKGDQDTVVAFQSSLGTRGGDVYEDGSATTVRVGSGIGIPSPPAVASAMAVRRLTPRECERLQGFPDDYTLVEYRKKPAADGPRYRALGNSMAVPVMRWIGERIALVERITAPAADPP